jgi:hypothetical protein
LKQWSAIRVEAYGRQTDEISGSIGATAEFPFDRLTVERFREACARARWSDTRKAWFVPRALLNQYTKAVQLSQKAGHQVSFRVVVEPRAGAQTISIVEEDPLVGDGAFPVEEAGEPGLLTHRISRDFWQVLPQACAVASVTKRARQSA